MSKQTDWKMYHAQLELCHANMESSWAIYWGATSDAARVLDTIRKLRDHLDNAEQLLREIKSGDLEYGDDADSSNGRAIQVSSETPEGSNVLVETSSRHSEGVV